MVALLAPVTGLWSPCRMEKEGDEMEKLLVWWCAGDHAAGASLPLWPAQAPREARGQWGDQHNPTHNQKHGVPFTARSGAAQSAHHHTSPHHHGQPFPNAPGTLRKWSSWCPRPA